MPLDVHPLAALLVTVSVQGNVRAHALEDAAHVAEGVLAAPAAVIAVHLVLAAATMAAQGRKEDKCKATHH